MATVHGVVRNSASGEPLPRALVRIEGDAATGTLEEPHGAAPVYHDSEPGAKPSAWRHFAKTMGGRGGTDAWKRER